MVIRDVRSFLVGFEEESSGLLNGDGKELLKAMVKGDKEVEGEGSLLIGIFIVVLKTLDALGYVADEVLIGDVERVNDLGSELGALTTAPVLYRVEGYGLLNIDTLEKLMGVEILMVVVKYGGMLPEVLRSPGKVT